MNIFVKPLLYLVVFSLLHFGYDFTYFGFLKPFCGTNESVFQHLKMAFWAYIITSTIEYFITMKRRDKSKNFWYSRMFAAIIVPWIILLIWYLAPAVYGKFQFPIYEIIWALVVTYFSGVMAGILEKNLETQVFKMGFKIVIILLLIVSILLYIRFTYQLPWVDLFVDPELL